MRARYHAKVKDVKRTKVKLQRQRFAECFYRIGINSGMKLKRLPV